MVRQEYDFREYQHQYFLKNKESIKARQRKWYLENKTRILDKLHSKYVPRIRKIPGLTPSYSQEYRRQVQRRLYYTPTSRYNHYKGTAKSKNHLFELSKEQFNQFWQKPCYYCGASISHIGLDRMDNDKGYLIDNVVSCCIDCNKMKKTKSKEQFIDKCKLIASRFS